MNDEYDDAGYIRQPRMSMEERRQKRAKKSHATNERVDVKGGSGASHRNVLDDRFADLLKRNEDDLLEFVAKVNHVYQEKLKKDAPFITFMFCGMQSAGKSTIMERFMNAVLNIVQEGTGTRCPLDTTCIHDEKCIEPICSLHGNELGKPGTNLNVNQVFERITSHNKKLCDEDRFSTEALRLVYKANNVQNMRFVDTPGIISTKGLGNDNREDIKRILRAEMCKSNTKLCVLLEPKEFATNDIINFCDETFGKRDKWMPNATFLMTKFDKQLEDARTGSKANNFFNMFHECGCFPHLIITPTLPKEDLPAVELYQARLELLRSADKVERERFSCWLQSHDQYRQQDPSDSLLNPAVASKIGFKSAKTVMREIMLQDTVKRLPEVIAELRKELSILVKEKKMLEEKMKLNDPAKLKAIVAVILYGVINQINSYLDGDLEMAMNFPATLQTLNDEIDEEENSKWAEKELNQYTAEEDMWRDLIANYEGDYPASVHPTRALFGGKQVQRSIDFFKMVMIEALPDPFDLKKVVVNATGFLGGGLQRENWERATVQVIKVSVKKVSHPGINFLIKHIGYIFRRLFTVALDVVIRGDETSSTFHCLPSAVEKHFLKEFDDMLWKLMVEAASQTHTSMEPMYSTVDPNLPTFNPSKIENDHDDSKKYVRVNRHEYVPAEELEEESWLESAKAKMTALYAGSGADAKLALKIESEARANKKVHFLPDERTPMITDEELDVVLRRSLEYIVALVEFNVFVMKSQITHYLFLGFKRELGMTFKNKIMNEADWSTLVELDPLLKQRFDEVTGKIEGVHGSLIEVERLQRKL